MIRKFILSALMIFALTISVLSQDTIFKKDGTQIKAKVLEVTVTVVKYKKFANREGPTYEAAKGDLLKIVYPDGSVDDFSKEAASTTQNQMNAIKEMMKAAVNSGYTSNGKVSLKLNGKDHITEYNRLTVGEAGSQQSLFGKDRTAVVMVLTSTIVTPDKKIVVTFTLTENDMKPATFKAVSGNTLERVDKRFMVSVSYINPDVNMGIVGNNIPINNIKSGRLTIDTIDREKRTISGTFQVTGSTVDGGKIELEGSLSSIAY